MATSVLSARRAAISMSSDTSSLAAGSPGGSPGSAGSLPGSAGSLPGKAGLSRSVVHEAAHAGPGVLRGEQPGELQPLDLQAGAQVDLQAVVDGLLGGPQGERGAGSVPGHPGAGRVVN